MKITLFTLVWDTAEGTDCRLFGSESEWFDYFSGIITDDIAGIETPEAMKIRTALREGNIGLAYELWQTYYKCELDTFNWDEQTITVGTGGEILEIVPGPGGSL
jgi:hypothetical protein